MGAVNGASNQREGNEMTRTLKVIGLGLVAPLAISAALAAPSASASETNHTGGHFALQSGVSAALHGHGGPGTFHQVKLHKFGQTVECTETYSGSITASKVSSISITPHYTDCANGVIFHVNDCTYTFQVRQTNASTKHSPMSIVCPITNRIVITGPNCTTTIGSQTITAAVVYTRVNVGGIHQITADITATGIKYEKHGLCEFLSPFGTGPHSGAEMTGNMLLKGTNGAPVGITATGTNGA